jgi:hypothetical protein
MKVLLANNPDFAGLKVTARKAPSPIVPFRLTVKPISTDLSLFDASVTCTQLERDNNFPTS